VEVTGLGKIGPPVSIGSTQPYRRHIIGLPLQRSLFNQAARAATTIGFPSLSSERDFPARLDENGDLFLDRSKVASLTDGLTGWLTPKNLGVMHQTHAAACAALIKASEDAATGSGRTGTEATTSCEDLANRLSLVLAYGILAKFVPDILLRALAGAGDVEPPPFPEKSAGAELMQDTFALYQACSARGYPPERLRQEWPRVSAEVLQLVKEFCNRQTGFGPLAWDSPGYEDPAYVVRLLHSAFHEVDPEQVSHRLGSAKKSSSILSRSEVPAQIAALREVLGYWLTFLEWETWYVRRAFYRGMVPLLQDLAARFREKISGLQPADLLFLEIAELTGETPDPAMIESRRDCYLANTHYLSLHGVEQNRLTLMIGNP